jgi:hypothetical protein
MSRPRYLYLAQIGEQVKVGIAVDLEQRLTQHRQAAAREEKAFRVITVLPPHAEALENERTIVDRFGPPGSRSEYLDVDEGEVLAAVRGLPCTPAEIESRLPLLAPESTTSTSEECLPDLPPRAIGAEIRAEMARQQIAATDLAQALGHRDRGRSLRRKMRGEQQFTAQDVKRIATVLNVTVDHLLRKDTK